MKSSANVLVVEDNSEVRRAFVDLFELQGWVVAESSNGIQALRALEEGLAPAAIVLDLELPFLSGWHLHRKLQEHASFSRIPVIIVTAHEVGTAGVAGAYAVLCKPLSPQLLLDTLHACMTHH